MFYASTEAYPPVNEEQKQPEQLVVGQLRRRLAGDRGGPQCSGDPLLERHDLLLADETTCDADVAVAVILIVAGDDDAAIFTAAAGVSLG